MWPTLPVAGPHASEGSIQRKRKPELSLDSQKATISVTDKDALRRYYEKVFQNLQQTNCRVIAKVRQARRAAQAGQLSLQWQEDSRWRDPAIEPRRDQAAMVAVRSEPSRA